MAEITLTYDVRNPLAKKTISYILSLGIFEKSDKKNAVEKSLQEAKKGKTHTYKSVDDFFDKVLR